MEKDKKPCTYAQAGVDIRRENHAIKGIKNWVQKTYKFREGKIGCVMKDTASFANIIEFGDYALAISMDSAGSKVLVAQELEKYDTIGIDAIAMNVNDVICVGAEPITMVDYLAVASVNDDMIKEISIGLYEGAKQSGIACIGGETATMPEVIKGVGNKGFDIAATVIGVVRKEDIVTGEKVVPGDVVVGISSSGIHSNGLTLARKVLPKSMWMKLLNPTRIYVNEVMTLLDEFEVHGLANITGSGMLKLTRITKHGFVLDNLPEPHIIFKKIQELGKVSDPEMYRTFNMGVGLCVIADKKTGEAMVEKYGKEYGMQIIGRVVEEPGVRIRLGDSETTI